MDGTFTGTVDRVVDDTTAVILVEDDEEVVEQVTVPVEDLPDEARDDRRLTLTFRDGELVSMADDPGTRERAESLRETFDRLSTRLSEE